MSGTVRIGGAFALAILIVGGSLYLRSTNTTTQASQGAIVAAAPFRTYIEPVDSDGDGVPDWEQSLSARVFEAITAPTGTNPFAPDVPYEPPTTFTGKFSEAFFRDYIEGKMAGENYLENPDKLINDALVAIQESTRTKTFNRFEIRTVPGTGETVRNYGNAVMEASASYPLRDINQIELLSAALDRDDPGLLDILFENVRAYERIIEETLTVEVPEPLVNFHLALLNSYEALRVDTLAMQRIFDDPLYGLARSKEYFNDSEAMLRALKNIRSYLEKNGIDYTKDEQGARLYALDAINL